jgi:hypothetical protein
VNRLDYSSSSSDSEDDGQEPGQGSRGGGAAAAAARDSPMWRDAISGPTTNDSFVGLQNFVSLLMSGSEQDRPPQAAARAAAAGFVAPSRTVNVIAAAVDRSRAAVYGAAVRNLEQRRDDQQQQQQHEPYLPARHPLHVAHPPPGVIGPSGSFSSPALSSRPRNQLREIAVMDLGTGIVVFPGDSLPLRVRGPWLRFLSKEVERARLQPTQHEAVQFGVLAKPSPRPASATGGRASVAAAGSSRLSWTRQGWGPRRLSRFSDRVVRELQRAADGDDDASSLGSGGSSSRSSFRTQDSALVRLGRDRQAPGVASAAANVAAEASASPLETGPIVRDPQLEPPADDPPRAAARTGRSASDPMGQGDGEARRMDMSASSDDDDISMPALIPRSAVARGWEAPSAAGDSGGSINAQVPEQIPRSAFLPELRNPADLSSSSSDSDDDGGDILSHASVPESQLVSPFATRVGWMDGFLLDPIGLGELHRQPDDDAVTGRIGTIVTVLYTHGDAISRPDDRALAPSSTVWREHGQELVVTAMGTGRFRTVRALPAERNGVKRYAVEELTEDEVARPNPAVSRLFGKFDEVRGLAHATPLPAFVWRRAWPEHLASQIRLAIEQSSLHQSLARSMNEDHRRPMQLSYWLSSNMALPQHEKLQLLEMVSPVERLRWILRKLQETERSDTVIQCKRCGCPLTRGSRAFTVGGSQGTTGNCTLRSAFDARLHRVVRLETLTKLVGF